MMALRVVQFVMGVAMPKIDLPDYPGALQCFHGPVNSHSINARFFCMLPNRFNPNRLMLAGQPVHDRGPGVSRPQSSLMEHGGR